MAYRFRELGEIAQLVTVLFEKKILNFCYPSVYPFFQSNSFDHADELPFLFLGKVNELKR